MHQLARLRLLIIVLLGFGLGLVPIVTGAQDIPTGGVDPPPDAGTESLPSDEGVTQEELSSILVIKYVCPEIDEEAEDFCIGRDEAVEGSAIEFVLIGPDDSGEEFWFDVVIEEFEGDSSGATQVTDVPRGSYELCEAVPEGYVGFAVPLSETQEAYDNCIAFDVGETEEELLFVNGPEEIVELPDTGSGLTIVPAPGIWVPVLVSGALLAVLAGSHLRWRMNG